MRISVIDDTNSGTTVADKPTIISARSSHLPACSAAQTPAEIASGTTMTNASAPSFAERSSASPTNGATGER
jgi:hypothetical protein